ncbi:MAG: hypothetical protein J0H61_02030 [Alphaproteobacteria bacterium]|jgi:hypothetical protein|nr:hypothetical protein [Alphaproteobacteria bacterium]
MKWRFAILALSLAVAGCAAPAQRGPAPAPGISPATPAPPRPPEPPQFHGMAAAKLRSLAGTPAFQRKDGAIEMWRYDAAACHAFFFLSGAPSKVEHVETLPAGKDGGADPACLIALQGAAKTS